jgi:hypothetical protein
MHRIEPFYLWRDFYRAEEDPESITYGKEYSELYFTDKIYNYIIHPQWDSIGSETLFYKTLFVDYNTEFAVIELIGEWNDCIGNDIMMLKTELIDPLIDSGVQHFILIMENVLNFHANDQDYYHEWVDDIDGEIYMLNALPQVLAELDQHQFANYIWYDGPLNEVDWRVLRPESVLQHLRSNLSRLVHG